MRTLQQRRKEIRDAMVLWAERYGDPPRVQDWRNVRDPEFIRKHGEGWPSYLTAIRCSPDGTWDGMIRNAGYVPRGRGRPPAK